MYAYCMNNPVVLVDPAGTCSYISSLGGWVDCNEIDCPESKKYVAGDYSEELAVLRGETDRYKGVQVHKILPNDNSGFSFGDIYIGTNAGDTWADVNLLRHEFGHTVQFDNLGMVGYGMPVLVPSVSCYAIDQMGLLTAHYYSLPWEFEADTYGNVVRNGGYDYRFAFFYMDYKAFTAYVTGDVENYPVYLYT